MQWLRQMSFSNSCTQHGDGITKWDYRYCYNRIEIFESYTAKLNLNSIKSLKSVIAACSLKIMMVFLQSFYVVLERLSNVW